MTRILLVTGSRALEGSDRFREAKAMLIAYIETITPTVVVAGDARGPDEWAIEAAVLRRIDTRIYGLDGWVKTAAGRDVRRWTESEKFSPLDRNAAMVREVAAQRDKGALVRVLALEALWSATKGTAHTIARAREHGLEVTHVTFARER